MVPAATATNQATYGLSGRYLIIGRADVCLNGGASYDYNSPVDSNNPPSAAVGNCALGGDGLPRHEDRHRETRTPQARKEPQGERGRQWQDPSHVEHGSG